MDRAFVHDLRSGSRSAVPVEEAAVEGAERRVHEMVQHIRSRQFDPQPGEPCKRCDVRELCPHRAD